MTSPSFHSSPSCRVLAFARTWSIEALDPATMRSLRERIRDLGADLIVVTSTGAWAFNGSDDDGEYSDRIAADLATAASMFAHRAGGDAVFVVDGSRVVRVGHDAPSLVEALGAAAELLVTRRIATTTGRTPIASLVRWPVERAS
jgi:hypothetical protein